MHKNIIDDVNITAIKQLITPIELMEQFPLTANAVNTVTATRGIAKNIVQKKDDRLLVIIGPCSIHNTKAAIEYGALLRASIEKLQNELCLIMRVYFEKPRTCVGWKGLINDPKLDGSFDINQGLSLARQLLLALNDRGIPTATEFLDTTIPQFICDLISWGAIGARTTESQIHRELASGLSMPIGFKNGTDGNVDIAIDAIRAASFVHHFLGITKSSRAAILSTAGNDACHIILRGGKNKTNYDQASVMQATHELKKQNLLSAIMIDCSHGNSMKKHENQLEVVEDIAKQVSAGSEDIMGVMLESHLIAGSQSFVVGQKPSYNQSITDACISWEQTKPILKKLAEAVKTRRRKI